MNSDSCSPRPRGWFLVFAISVCASAFVCPVQAQEDAAASSETLKGSDGDGANSEEYRVLITQALNEFKHKNWPEARILFRRAHELSPSARTQRGMGVVSYEMRDYVQAVIALSAALVDARQPLNEAQKRECSGLLARARTFVGTYKLSLEPDDAEVTVDGSPLVRDAEGHVLVPFGEHQLSASAAGYRTSTSKLNVQGGEQGELRVVLYPEGSAPALAAPLGRIEATSEQPPVATPPARSRAAEPRGFVGGGLRYTWVALGASAAFGATAAAVWFTGEKKVDELADDCSQRRSEGAPCLRGQTDTSQIDRYERATTALLGLSALSFATSIALASFEWPRERKVALQLGPQRLAVRGSF
jgi:hypothetical protein